ncbi:MAG: virulence factor Mce family protein [Solirubrobacterales bacterium]|nr:virulence factor Mce family protein [Solirubrobacterales bacterium]
MKGPVRGFRGHLLTAGVALLLAAGSSVAFLGIGGGLPSTGGDAYEVRVVLSNSASLIRGSRITMAGTTVGKVSDIRRQGFSTIATLRITDQRVVPISASTRVNLRQRTPVGENYVELRPGGAKAELPSGGTLRASQSDEYVDVDQVLSILSGPTRNRARQLFQNLGGALDGRGQQLNDILGDASTTVQAGSKAFTLLDADRAHVGNVVSSLESIMDAVGERRQTVATLSRQGLRSLQAVASRDTALRQTIAVLPSTLEQVRSTSGKVDDITATASPVVANLARAVHDVRPAVTSLRPAAQQGSQILAELTTAAPRLNTTLKRAKALSSPLSNALPQLHKAICQLNPVIRYTKPYTDDIGQLLMGLGSASNGYDAIGHLIRITPIVNENSLVGAPEAVTTAMHTLLRAGFLAKSQGLRREPYPKPDMNGKATAGTSPNEPITAAEVKQSGYVFPHVVSDC